MALILERILIPFAPVALFLFVVAMTFLDLARREATSRSRRHLKRVAVGFVLYLVLAGVAAFG